MSGLPAGGLCKEGGRQDSSRSTGWRRAVAGAPAAEAGAAGHREQGKLTGLETPTDTLLVSIRSLQVCSRFESLEEEAEAAREVWSEYEVLRARARMELQD